MEKTYRERVKEFALDYILTLFYVGDEISVDQFIYNFGKECVDLGFDNSIEATLEYVYPDIYEDTARMEEDIREILDIKKVGSVIFSKFQDIIFDGNEDAFTQYEVRDWFRTGLDWLKELSSYTSPPFYGKADQIIIKCNNKEHFFPRSSAIGQVLKETLTFFRDGHVECLQEIEVESPEGDGQTITQTVQKNYQIEREKAEKLFADLIKHFNDNVVFYQEWEDTVGYDSGWTMEIRSLKGNSYLYKGYFSQDPEYKGEYNREKRLFEHDSFSNIIRDLLDDQKLFVFSGQKRPNSILGIDLTYNRYSTKDQETDLSFFFLPIYTEKWHIDRDAETVTVEQKLVDINKRNDNKVKTVFEFGNEEVSNFLDDQSLSRFETMQEKSIQGKDYLVSGVREFRLNIESNLEEPFEATGVYNKNGLPATWPYFIKDLVKLLGSKINFEVIDEEFYAQEQPSPDGVYYLEVVIEGDDMSRFYWTNEGNIRKGDYVEVPYGKDNEPKEARVIHREFYYYPEAYPFPIETIKPIIRKIYK